MNELQQVIDQYVSIWNETDAARRRDLIAATWTADGTYRDPLVSSDGHAGFDALIQGVQDQFPDHKLRFTCEVEAVGDRVQFGWAVVNAASGTPLVAGVDIGQVGQDGRLQSVTGFINQAPVLAGAS